MNLTLLTHYIPTEKEDYQKIADLTVPGRKIYCERHGYAWAVYRGTYRDANLYWAIQRLHLIYDILFTESSQTDIVWVLNPQSLITNYSKPVIDYLDAAHDFFVCADINGINMASFVVRKTEWSKRYLEMLLELAPRIGHTWHEQQAVIVTKDLPEWRDKIKILDHPSINSYLYSRLYNRPDSTPGQWHKGHLVLSLPGTTFADRMKIIPEFLLGDNITY